MSQLITIPQTDLKVHPLCLGGNVFGWSASEAESFEVLDAYVAAGGNFIDTADIYSEWKTGNSGGESETIIGNWMKARGNRSQIVIATKVAKYSKRPGLSAENIRSAAQDSLHRLQTDYIDLYYAHEDDPKVSMVETLGTFNELVTQGKVRYLGASNFNSIRLREALQTSEESGFAKYSVIQNQYNLLDRKPYETDMAPTLKEFGITSLPFYGLARGFLTGKYREGVSVNSVRAGGVADYQNRRGWKTLAALTDIATVRQVSLAAVALGWLRGQETVSTPIASARTVEQLREIMPVVELSSRELESLSAITA